MSKHSIVLDNTQKYSQKIESYGKPYGLWYAFGDAWLDWCSSEMPEWVGEYFYSVNIGKSNILVLRDVCEMVEFYRKYSVANPPYSMWGEFGNPIDWNQVARDYSGIEIPRYLWSCRMSHSWYYGWDVASGCVWNLKYVSITLMKERVLCPA